ncbi:hypothetical protein B296_00040236 [Ensete ventricosum]|uniref:SUEL-type lectin domain-containing protein n=1 Tax=Ensete ventricosum TaxID=4639 RepID=A0A426YLD5_ENSVE|nr:hypothetical protein B296_00040236 [Ensete ventricosum]
MASRCSLHHPTPWATMAVSPETTARSSIRTLFLLTLLVSDVEGRRGGTSQGVKYDSRSLIINGRIQLLFSGSVHYPRSTPEVENEYNNVAHAYKDAGLRYVQWVGNMGDVQGEVCSRVFGDPPSQRSAEDLAYSVARFFSKNGTLVNYYMVITASLLDNKARRKKKAYRNGFGCSLTVSWRNKLWKARVYENPGMKACAAFLSNSNRKIDGTVNFKGDFTAQCEDVPRSQGNQHEQPVADAQGPRSESEKLGIFDEKGVNNVNWTQAQNDTPIAWYHVPRSLLKPKDNLMVVFEEHRGKPEGIVMMTVKRDNICTFVSELFPGQALSSLRESSKLRTVAHPEAHLKCTGKKVIRSIAFASFGNPEGLCGNCSRGSCHAPQTKPVVEKVTFHYHATHLSSSTPTHPPLRSTLPDLLGKEELRVVDVV